jgi:hypothetical protein
VWGLIKRNFCGSAKKGANIRRNVFFSCKGSLLGFWGHTAFFGAMGTKKKVFTAILALDGSATARGPASLFAEAVLCGHARAVARALDHDRPLGAGAVPVA